VACSNFEPYLCMFHVSYYSLSYSCQLYANMYLWMPEIQWWLFSCQYAESEKTRGFGFINLMFQFYWFYLPKSDGPVLTDLAYISPILFIVILLSCASHILCSHTQIVAHIRCIHVGGSLLDFLEKYVKWHLYAKFKFHSICTYLGGANTICMYQKFLLNIFCKL
jgi:hypothetical protein